MIVTVKSLNKNKKQWSGFVGHRYKQAKHIIGAYYDRYGTRITGLSPEEEKELGEILDKDLRNTSPFWDDYHIIMTDKDLILNLDKPEDRLKYLVLKGHYEVAKSMSDKNPYAQYVIHDEEEEAKMLNTSASIKVKAYSLFANLTLEEKANILRLYPGFTKTSNIKPEIIESKLFSKVEEDPATFVSRVQDKQREMKVFLKDLVSAGILKKNKSAYKYGTDFLGHDEESTIDFLNNPENQSLKITLMQELESKNN